MSAPKFAFFDLDHTILPFDTQAFFCNFVLRQEGWRRVYLLWFLPLAVLSALRLISLKTMKRIFHSYLVGMPRERLMRYVEEFVETEFAAVAYREVVAEIQRHRSEGRCLILNSASPDFYLAAIAEHLEFDYFLGTRMEIGERVALFPLIDGPNNKHEAKIEAMYQRGLIPTRQGGWQDSWAYSDSTADLPLLHLAEQGVMIHPNAQLAEEGRKAGWSTLRPVRPYSGKWGGRLAMASQIFGFYRVKNGES